MAHYLLAEMQEACTRGDIAEFKRCYDNDSCYISVADLLWHALSGGLAMTNYIMRKLYLKQHYHKWDPYDFRTFYGDVCDQMTDQSLNQVKMLYPYTQQCDNDYGFVCACAQGNIPVIKFLISAASRESIADGFRDASDDIRLVIATVYCATVDS